MKFALVNGQRQEAQPNLSGRCPTCDQPMVAKCGEVKIWHWAHQGGRVCDPWWENETEWHRAWKGQFPVNWQEVVHQAESGEKHIADVRTERGWVIEFQHSYLRPEERRSRDTFYPRLIWVVDGTRRKRDRAQLLKAWNEALPVGFFDFGEAEVLWWLFAKSPDGPTYIAKFSRARFIESHRGGATELAAREFDEFVNDIPKLIADYESHARAQALKRAATQAPQAFQQHLAHKYRRRRRL